MPHGQTDRVTSWARKKSHGSPILVLCKNDKTTTGQMATVITREQDNMIIKYEHFALFCWSSSQQGKTKCSYHNCDVSAELMNLYWPNWKEIDTLSDNIQGYCEALVVPSPWVELKFPRLRETTNSQGELEGNWERERVRANSSKVVVAIAVWQNLNIISPHKGSLFSRDLRCDYTWCLYRWTQDWAWQNIVV